MAGPLAGLLVVALEQAVAAPLASCRLADAGARVIKIERAEGDFARGYDAAARGQSAYFVWLNRGKESLVLDIKDPTDSALLERIIARADVFIQNLAPGAAARAGFDPEALQRRWPRLIACSVSGYGEDGPYRDIAMGGAAMVILIGTHAKVGILVILYAINVFITFTLSQLGMSVHWWRVRHAEPRWRHKLAINGIGCFFTFSILVLTLTLKFDEGGWVTVVITGAIIGACFLVRRHYDRFGAALRQLEADVAPLLYAAKREELPPYDPQGPTAGILVDGFNGLGLATLLTLTRLFPNQFDNVVFIGVGEVDSALLKGPAEVRELEQRMADDLKEYCQFASDLGLHAGFRSGIAPDIVPEIVRLCVDYAHEHPHIVFFAGKLIFSDEAEGYLGRFLHSHTALEAQRYLQVHGLSLVILPVRVTPVVEEKTGQSHLRLADPALP